MYYVSHFSPVFLLIFAPLLRSLLWYCCPFWLSIYTNWIYSNVDDYVPFYVSSYLISLFAFLSHLVILVAFLTYLILLLLVWPCVFYRHSYVAVLYFYHLFLLSYYLDSAFCYSFILPLFYFSLRSLILISWFTVSFGQMLTSSFIIKWLFAI